MAGKEIITEINEAFAQLKVMNERRESEISQFGTALADTAATIARINGDMDEMKRQMAKNTPSIPAKTAGEEARSMMVASYNKYLRHGMQSDALSEVEKRALSGTSDGDGYFLVPDHLDNTILMNAYNAAAVRPVASKRKTGRNAISVGSLVKPTVAWGTKGICVADQVSGTGRTTIEVNFLHGLLLVDQDMLDDADADIAEVLSKGFGEAKAEAEDDAFMTGNGVNEPEGILTNATIAASYIPSGVAAALTDSTNNGFDVMLEAYYALNAKYRRNAHWAWNSQTEHVLRTIKDNEGRYMFQPSLAIGTPATFNGVPIINPEGMPDIAANSLPIVIGDFSRYWIADRQSFAIQRLNERYAECHQVGFKVRFRVGGAPVLPEAFIPIKIATS